MLDLTGKVAVIIGAGSGIGRGIALALAKAGADVVVSDLFPDRAGETASQAKILGRNAVAREVDVRDPELVHALAATAVDEFGRLDICVANAGIGRLGSVLSLSLDDWNDVIAVNQTGVFLTVQACAREMVRLKRGGRIITLASIAAEQPSARLFPYNATKAAVRMMTRCWALDLAPFGITVNSIGPGVIDTPLGELAAGSTESFQAVAAAIPLGRTGRTEDIGNLACWLASDEASYVTGTYNVIDGGYLDRPWHGADAVTSQYVDARKRMEEMSGDDLLDSIDQLNNQATQTVTAHRDKLGLQ
ncbi:MAG: SDR family NAD(P)-dependent oxidoreductase [Nitrolancea sp.]